MNANGYTANSAAITNTASNPGTADRVDADGFSGCVVGVDAGTGGVGCGAFWKQKQTI